MDELNSKLAEILNDPESMNRVRQMAESILSENGEKDEPLSETPDTAEITRIMEIVSKLNKKSDDKRTALLLALKPNLSQKKQEKVDTAIKILRLIELLPILKESGVLGKLL